MKLFGKKKDENVPPRPPVPFSPVGSQMPPTPKAVKRTLAQDIGLSKPSSDLPPLPPLEMKGPAAPKPMDLPPLPTESDIPDLGDLPPLPEQPSADLPPLPVEDEGPVLPEPVSSTPEQPQSQAPIFIRLDKYNDIVNTVNQMESRINELQNAIKKVGEVKQKEKEIIDNWSKLIDEAKDKVNAVNTKLPEPKR